MAKSAALGGVIVPMMERIKVEHPGFQIIDEAEVNIFDHLPQASVPNSLSLRTPEDDQAQGEAASSAAGPALAPAANAPVPIAGGAAADVVVPAPARAPPAH